MTGEQSRSRSSNLAYRRAILDGGAALQNITSQWTAGSEVEERSVSVLIHDKETARVVGKLEEA